MKNKSYLVAVVVGIIAGAIINVEMLFLGGYRTIEEQYMQAIFPFDMFLKQKEYILSFNMVLLSLLFLCMSVNLMKKYHVPYALLRVKKRYRWELKLTKDVIKLAFAFYFGFSLTVFVMSIFSCDAIITLSTCKTWILSLIALVYLGILLGCMVNLFSCIMKAKTAVLISYIVFLTVTYMTMYGEHLFIKSKAILYLNPISAVSITEETDIGIIVGVLLGMCAICCVCINILAFTYTRWENYVEA